ncbi:MAG: insulinase family protein [Candidatus Delongbacteria bacterium]|nr:insulinase family protein [Candidatus Delongbacteria bacterium]MBN2834912.1 insulinase family protein [Candidatus Delongbacteria bacterium]
MIKLLSILLILAFSAFGLDLSQPLPFDPNVKTGQLENGFTYYIQQNSYPKDKVEMYLMTNAGSVDEDEGQEGLAHFTEHMCFNGTVNFPGNSLIDYTKSKGMAFGRDLNAFTSYDRIVYMLSVPLGDEELLEKSFQIMEDWANNLLMDGTEIDKERGVIIEEWRGSLGSYKRMDTEITKVLFNNSKYAERTPIGLKEVIENFEHETIRKYYKDWFRPDLQGVAIVGDIDPVKMEEMVNKYFNRIPKPENPREKVYFEVPDKEGTDYIVLKDPESPETDVSIYLRLPKTSTKTIGDMKNNLIENIYFTMFNNRLQEISQSKDSPFLRAYGYSYSFIKTKKFYTASANVENNKVLDGYKALLTESRRVLLHGFTAGEFERAKTAIINNLENMLKEKDKQYSKRMIWKFISQFIDNVTAMSIEDNYALVKELISVVTLDEVNNLAKVYNSTDNRVVAVKGVDKEGITLPTEDELKKVSDEIETSNPTAYTDSFVEKPLVENTPQKGSIVSEETYTGDILKWTLSNGCEVYVRKTDYKDNEIIFKAQSFGGRNALSDEDNKFYRLANEFVNNSGLGPYNDTDLGKYLNGKMVRVSTQIGNRFEILDGSSSVDNLKDMFEIIYSYFTTPGNDEDAFTSMIKRNKSDLENLKNSPESVFRDTLISVASSYNPRSENYTMEDLDKVTKDQLYNIFRSRFNSTSDFKFVFTGNIDIEQLKDYCETYLASLPKVEQENFTNRNIAPPKGINEHLVYKGVDEKCSVGMLTSGDIEFNSVSKAKMNLYNGMLNQILLEEIREKKSGVYYVYGYGRLDNIKNNYIFNYGMGCNPERVDELTSGIIEIVENLSRSGFEQTYFDSQMEIIKSTQKTNEQTNSYWTSTVIEQLFDGTDKKLIFNPLKIYDQISFDDVNQFSKTFGFNKNYRLIVLYPESHKK